VVSASSIHPFVALWPLWLVVALILMGKAARFVWRERQLRRSVIREIDLMDGPTFERRLAVLFRGLGYVVEPVGATHGDFGADLIISKDGERSIVQAKRWRKNVGVKAVQEAVGARGFYSTDAAMVVTNRGFTPQARKLAQANGVKLWGREMLVTALLQTTAKSSRLAPALPVSALSESAGAAATSIEAEALPQMFCARCGKPVSDRVRDYCLSHRRRFAGLVYCYDHQRSV
jgi:restriction system protein